MSTPSRSVLASLPKTFSPRWNELSPLLASENSTLVILDDDPTGTQSVANLPVLINWTVADLCWALSLETRAVYVLTNSRSLHPAEAEAVTREVVSNALDAAKLVSRKIEFVTRSDSTLRGHFPLEPNTIAAVIRERTGEITHGIVLLPAFSDAGRITVHGVHYAGSIENDLFTPVGESEFANDSTFGYTSSDLIEWVEEKSGGTITPEQCFRIDIDTLRAGPEATEKRLLAAPQGCVVIVDCAHEADLQVFSAALHRARDSSRHYVFRVGPPFVRSRIGQDRSAPLDTAAIEKIIQQNPRPLTKGGLVVVGSHTGLTTSQLENFRSSHHPVEFEISVPEVQNAPERANYLKQISQAVTKQLEMGTVVITTSREKIVGATEAASLDIARTVSEAVCSVVQQILESKRPRFVVAKGGITSSDVASKGLGITRGMIQGTLLPGLVSLWEPLVGPSTGVPFVVFPGNVGGSEALSSVVTTLEGIHND